MTLDNKAGATRSKNRSLMIGAAVSAGVCALLAAFLLLVPMRGALEDERAFRAAVACGPGDGGRECLRTVRVRVEETAKKKGKKTPSFWVYVTEPDGTATRTRLEGAAEDVPGIREGGTIQVTYWRDQIRYVDTGAERRWTTADPRGDYRLYCAWGLAVGFYGLVFLWFCFWQAKLSSRSRLAYPWHAGVPALGALCLTAVAAVAPWFTDSPGQALGVIGLSAPVVAAVCAVIGLVMARRQRGDDTLRLERAVPGKELSFQGMVLGEVSYAGRGGFLVAGPGLLASTPDPTGVAYRREAPRTLTPVRVRPPYRTDPEGRPDYDGKALVLECEDDGVPVLVVTPRKTMKWVLGALPPIGPGGGTPRP
ncbi:hypothetical protein [Streptomyces nitrosporeus]|uniref:hypothetical protein n=1 Tax=Streptomyces nitrosporeus TaxID=28894 RepID=UPI00399FE7DB